MNSIAAGEQDGVPTGEAAPDEPVARADRIVALDFIRGIAVLGIVFANVVAFAYPALVYFWPAGYAGGATALDRAVWLFQFVFVDGKFRGLFTLLFGAGMMLFMERVWARGGTRWVQARRLSWLALFGLAHYFLLWTGDILFLYAISGFAALAMLRWDARKQLCVGLAWYCAGALLFSLVLGGQAAMEGMPEVQARAPEQAEQLREAKQDMLAGIGETGAVMRGRGYGGIVAWRVAEESDGLVQALSIALIETIPLMLIGMALYRMGLFEGRFDHPRVRRWAWIGLIGGALLTLPLGLWALLAGFPLMLTMFVFNGPVALLHLPMALGLAALLSLWAPRAGRTWLGARFVAVGRMAFSNYIGTSLVLVPIFYVWADELYAGLHRIALLPFVLLVWVLMLAWSKPWLAHFRFGPLEWLWRCLTYGRLFAFRRI